MPGSLLLLRGPAGSGKSQLARELIDTGEADTVIDFTRIHVALSALERDGDGKYPPREDGDPLVPLAAYVQAVAVNEALKRELRVVTTTSRSSDEEIERRRRMAEEAGAAFAVRTVDPGRAVVEARLTDSGTGMLSAACRTALARWYG